jgi:predicted DCC family thiol-disulfide oxidoreductase YuxK
MMRPRPRPAELLFYDGHCGLCHRLVRFILAKDHSGTAFRFAPLDGDTFRSLVPESRRAALGDSVVVYTAKGAVLSRSSAVVHILQRLGGVWRVLSVILWLIPLPLRNVAYDIVARVRHHLFRRPASVCPLIPEELRGRFIDINGSQDNM